MKKLIQKYNKVPTTIYVQGDWIECKFFYGQLNIELLKHTDFKMLVLIKVTSLSRTIFPVLTSYKVNFLKINQINVEMLSALCRWLQSWLNIPLTFISIVFPYEKGFKLSRWSYTCHICYSLLHRNVSNFSRILC